MHWNSPNQKGQPDRPKRASVPCHQGNVPVFETGNLRVYAGGSTSGACLHDGWVLLDLAGLNVWKNVTVVGDLPFQRVRRVGPRAVISVHWPDGEAPNLRRSFWEALLDDLADICATEPVNLLIACLGGHGRTGTALAIIVSLLDLVPEGECPVQWVRAHYCQNAVETEEQIVYIEAITGREVKAQARYAWSPVKGLPSQPFVGEETAK